MGERRSWKFDITLLWFIISEASYEFINTVSDQEMLGIKNGVAYSFFILVGFVGIIGLVLYGKKTNKSKIFKSRRNIILKMRRYILLGFFDHILNNPKSRTSKILTIHKESLEFNNFEKLNY